MWVLPFLYGSHPYPIATFYQEWGAALLGVCAVPMLVTQRYWRQPEIPRIVLFPIGLSLLVWLQFALGRVAYLDQALLLNLYLLWAALLIMLGPRLREEFGLPALATALAAFLLLGAELNALAGVLQHYRWRTFLDYMVAVKISAAVFGNMAQPNHFADYITLGLISLGLLRLHWRLRAWQVAVLAVPLLFVLTLSGSRSAWLYLLCIAAIAFLWQRRERKGGCDAAGNPPAYPLRVDKSSLPLLNYSLALVLGFGLMHIVVQIPWLAGSTGSVTTVERLIGQAGSTGNVTSVERLIGQAGDSSARFYLWREAWLIFTQFPLLGAGFGQFAWQHFQLGPMLRNTSITGLYNNAHNLVMQVAAEMGLAGLIVLLGTLALWLLQARSAQRTIYHWWGYCLLAVLGIHSLLEYPLWYAYFLGVAALTLGIFDTTTYRMELRGVGRLSVAAILLLGLLSLLQMLYIYKYRNFESVAGVLYESETNDSYAQHVRIQLIHDDLVAVRGHALLLRPTVETVLGEAEWDHVADKGALNGRVMHFSPISPAAYREALLLAKAGRQAEARVQMERAIWAYPSDFPENLKKLRTLANTDTNPARFPDLLEFALQKYGERQRAVHTKS